MGGSAHQNHSETKVNVGSLLALGSQDSSGRKRENCSQAPAIKCLGPEVMYIIFTNISLSNTSYTITPNFKRVRSPFPLILRS